MTPGRGPQRAVFSSRWGTILATSGVAIGLGNIWRFPYMMGQYGGAAFLALYLLLIVLFAIPCLWVEWALGRHTRCGPLGALERSGLPGGRRWGLFLVFSVTMAASYYGVVVSWVLYYTVSFTFRIRSQAPAPAFASFQTDPGTQMIYVALTAALACAVLHLGVRRGIERLSRFVLPLFFGLLLVLIVRVLTLPGAAAGLRQYLVPQWGALTPSTVLAALGQTFFSLGLGGTFMVVYGSYMRPEEDIPGTAAFTALADVGASLMAGLIIVPAALALQTDLRGGPGLLFETLPVVFERLPAGHLFGAVFFLSVFLVALLSLIAAYEVPVGEAVDELGWTRGRALTAMFAIQVALAIPATVIEPYIGWSDLVWGSTMQPAGGLVAIIALIWCLGRSGAMEEIRRNSRIAVPGWLYYWIRFVIPPAILIILIYGWVERLSQ